MSDGSLDEALRRDLATLDRAALRRAPHPVSDRHGAALRTATRGAIDFSSNDYLGLATDPRIADAIAEAVRREGTGSTAARLISGTHVLHAALEARIARFKGTEAALLFTSGFAANIGAIPALTKKGDIVYADALNHASLIDGCRLSRAETRVFPHNDMAALDAMLTEDATRAKRRWIVVDSVFSMDGDLAPIDEIVAVAKRHGAWTYVDDAHATGLLGANGRGSAEHFGVEGELDVVMGTLGKGVGTVGAFVAGSTALCDWLLNRARAFVFTTAAPPALAAGTMRALELVDEEPWRRERLRANARRIRSGLATLGWSCVGTDDGHIIPVVLGEAETTARVGAALRDRGFLVGAVRPPTVPLGSSRLRITASAAHDDVQIDAFLDALREELPAPS